MNNMEYTIEPTSKDYAFYSKFYLSRLEEEKRQILKWKIYTENMMSKTNDENVYKNMEDKHKKYEDMLVKIGEKLGEKMDGENDIFRKYVEEQLYYKQKQMINSKKKKESVQAKIKKDENFKKVLKAEYRTEKRSEYHDKKNIKYYYERMMNTELPSYMKDNLDRMTNDKGYIYRGIWYFGTIPGYNNRLTMYENIKGIKYIHEYIWDERNDTKYYRLYEKLSKNADAVLIEEKITNIKK